MASPKRERKRANRAAKRAEEERRRRWQRALAIVRRYAVYALTIGALLVVVTFVFGR